MNFAPAFGSIFTLAFADIITLGPIFGVQGGFYRVVPTGAPANPFALQAIVPEPASIAMWSLVSLAGAAVAWRNRKRLSRLRRAA